MNRMRLVAFATALLVACSEASDEPAGAAAAATEAAQTAGEAPGPCSLVSDVEMSGVIGSTVSRTEESTPKRCIYYTDNPVVFVDLEIDSENAAESWQGTKAGHSLIDAPQDSLAGMGDEAFFGPRDRLYILRGNTFVAIEAGFDDKVRPRARKVAALALSKVQ